MDESRDLKAALAAAQFARLTWDDDHQRLRRLNDPAYRVDRQQLDDAVHRRFQLLELAHAFGLAQLFAGKAGPIVGFGEIENGGAAKACFERLNLCTQALDGSLQTPSVGLLDVDIPHGLGAHLFVFEQLKFGVKAALCQLRPRSQRALRLFISTRK